MLDDTLLLEVEDDLLELDELVDEEELDELLEDIDDELDDLLLDDTDDELEDLLELDMLDDTLLLDEDDDLLELDDDATATGAPLAPPKISLYCVATVGALRARFEPPS